MGEGGMGIVFGGKDRLTGRQRRLLMDDSAEWRQAATHC